MVVPAAAEIDNCAIITSTFYLDLVSAPLEKEPAGLIFSTSSSALYRRREEISIGFSCGNYQSVVAAQNWPSIWSEPEN